MGKKNQSKKKHSRNHSGWNQYYQSRTAAAKRAVQVNPNQPMLSISMLVSGRQETTDKSIDSLDQLRSRVSSELILVDTGCSEEMHEHLAQKADKIVKFTWCDDFSAARMAGLQEAKGQWFMFVDDDEWFEDTTEIEEFFLSGTYLRYESASYVQRNYLDLSGEKWRNMHVTRMTKIRPQTRFFYPIHESLWPLLEPEKYFEAYVHHYGYADPDPEFQMAKRKRNLSLLLPTIEKDPHCMKHYLQTVAEYYAMRDYKSACETADKGIANCDPTRVENAVHIDALHAAAVKMRLEQWHMEDAARLGKEYLEHAKISDLARAAIYGNLIFAYGELQKYGECLDCAQNYLRWKDYFDQNKEKLYRQDTLILDITFDPNWFKKAMGWAFAAALAVGNADTVEEMLAGKPLDLWLNSVRDWYTLIAQPHRDKWKQDFSAMMEPLEGAAEGRKGRCRMDHWEESNAPYAHLWQFYRILTMPEEQMAAQEALDAAGTADGVRGDAGAGQTCGGAAHSGTGAEQMAGQADAEAGQTCGGTVNSGTGAEQMAGQPESGRACPESKVEQAAVQADTGAAQTVSDNTGAAQGKTVVSENSSGGSTQSAAESEPEMSVSQEMAQLTAQLKEKVRFLIRQGQYQAAHGVVLQLRGFFPQDPELMELQVLCEGRE